MTAAIPPVDGGVERAAAALASAEAIVITAGAGMGVDSGLPDFRGPQGFWRAYPPYRKLGLAFEDLASPRWFVDDPHLAWGFYGHRRNLYRKTVPHAGFAVLREWAARLEAFVFTSNVDGQFQRAGFDAERICEVHGAIEVMQCTRPSCLGRWQAGPEDVDVDESTFRAKDPLPSCPRCHNIARPNILMFGDGGWDERRTEQQLERLTAFRKTIALARTVVVECGAGLGVPTVRRFGEELARAGATLVRINLREPEVPPDTGAVGIAQGAKSALQAIAARQGAAKG